MENMVTEQAISAFDNANFYWAAGIYLFNILIVQPFTPSRLEGDSIWAKGYNLVMGVLKIAAGNFLKAKNVDDVISKRKK